MNLTIWEISVSKISHIDLELSGSPKVKLDMPFDSRHIISYTCSVVTIALSRTETLFFSRWPWCGLSRSPKAKLIMPFDSRHITSYTCSIVTTALSRTETLFFSRWPWSGLSRSPKVKLIMPFDSQHIISCTCSIVTIALSHTEILFFSRWPRPNVKLIIRRLVDERFWNFIIVELNYFTGTIYVCYTQKLIRL